MAAGRCSSQDAFDILVEVSKHTQTKLRVVAQGVVDTASHNPGSRLPVAAGGARVAQPSRRPRLPGPQRRPAPEMAVPFGTAGAAVRLALYATDFSVTAITPRPVRQQPTWPRPHLNVTTMCSTVFWTPRI